MVQHKRGLSGSQDTPRGGTAHTSPGIGEAGTARDNTAEAKFWCSHRGGPFLIHKVGECEPETIDNAGYLDDYDVAIEQGFAPCPKCI